MLKGFPVNSLNRRIFGKIIKEEKEIQFPKNAIALLPPPNQRKIKK